MESNFYDVQQGASAVTSQKGPVWALAAGYLHLSVPINGHACPFVLRHFPK